MACWFRSGWVRGWQIHGVESEHRTLARVIANDIGLSSVPELTGTLELVAPTNHMSNYIAYERTYTTLLPNIDAVVTALTPYVVSGATGFSTTPYSFNTTAGFYSTPSSVVQDAFIFFARFRSSMAERRSLLVLVARCFLSTLAGRGSAARPEQLPGDR